MSLKKCRNMNIYIKKYFLKKMPLLELYIKH